MSSQDILPGGVPNVGGTVTTLGGTATPVTGGSGNWAAFAEILLTGSTAYLAAYPWTQGSVSFDARIIEWDRIERSIPAQAGLAQHGNTRIRVADADREIRALLRSYVFRRRQCKIYLAQRGGPSILSTVPIFTGEIFQIRYGEAWVEFTLRDTLYGWMDEEFPAMITPEIFPELPLTEPLFAPILQGHLVAADGQGKVPLSRIGLYGSPAVDRWIVACHEVWDVIAVYRREPGDGIFTLVDPSEYNISTDTREAFNLTLTFTFLDFVSAQPDGTEIAIDVDGIDFRGAWGLLPEASGAVLRNPIDFYINMTYFFLAKSGRADVAEIFDTATISALRDRCEPTGDNPCLCDVALLSPFTAREFHGQFCASFEMYIYQQQSLVSNPGTIALGLLDDSTQGPSFTEIGVIDRGTFEESVGDPSYNEILAYFGKNYRTGRFESQTTYTNDTEQGMLGA